MAKQIVTTLVDDIDGGKAAETVRFAFDGVHYEIDLSTKNATRMRKAFEEFVSHARRVGGRQVARQGKARQRSASQAPAIRTWARENGVEVPARGVIPETVREAFHAAQG